MIGLESSANTWKRMSEYRYWNDGHQWTVQCSTFVFLPHIPIGFDIPVGFGILKIIKISNVKFVAQQQRYKSWKSGNLNIVGTSWMKRNLKCGIYFYSNFVNFRKNPLFRRKKTFGFGMKPLFGCIWSEFLVTEQIWEDVLFQTSVNWKQLYSLV